MIFLISVSTSRCVLVPWAWLVDMEFDENSPVSQVASRSGGAAVAYLLSYPAFGISLYGCISTRMFEGKQHSCISHDISIF